MKKVQINLENVGKKFNREWIFRDIQLQLDEKQPYVVVGANGSGKSTFLQVLAGIMPFSNGKIHYHIIDKPIIVEEIYKYLALAAPYLELIEEMTLEELIHFHIQFKPLRNKLSAKDLINILGLDKSKSKYLKHFSSGMKQRVKLGLAFYAETPILFLDEPTVNLDKQGIAWYKEEITRNLANRLCVICSNQTDEYDFFEHHLLDISQFKHSNKSKNEKD